MPKRPAAARLFPVLCVAVCTAGCEAEPDGGAPEGRTQAVEPAARTPESPAAEPDYARLREMVCDTLRNSFDCARAIEARRLPESERAVRHGDTLRLRLAGADTARYVDQPGDPPRVAYYSYQGYWREPGLYLVHVQHYEGSAFLLVDDSTGAETRLPDWPLRSPDGRRFAVMSLDLVAGYGPNTLQVWSLEEGRPVRQWETEPSQWGPTGGEWTAPDTLVFTQRGYCDQLGGSGRSMCDRPARLWREAATWQIEAIGAARAR